MGICYITQAVLCGKHLNILCVIEAVNFICSRGFNRHWFHEFLSDMEAGYPHLFYAAV